MSNEVEVLEAWQRGDITIDEAILETGAGDAWALWELALDCGIEILIGDRDQIRGAIEGKRQIERGEGWTWAM